MGNRFTNEKAQAIAIEYCTNGFKKVAALISVGYRQSYANCKRGLSLYNNVKVKSAIAKIQTASVAKTGYSVAQAQEEYEEARNLAMRVNQPAAAATAITGKARLYGMDKDANIGEKTIIIISPRVSKVVESTPIEPQDGDAGAKEAERMG
jgi:hypothetical protein